jgi:hypothetical protein
LPWYELCIPARSSPWYDLCIPTRSSQPDHLAAADRGPRFSEDRPLTYNGRLGPDEIRLVLLYPILRRRNNRIFLSTEVVPTKSATGNYCALSYVCGDQTDKVPIWVDNHKFQVTRNLRSALRDVRNTLHPEQVLWMWIDAISINQNDINERNAQVQKMKQIFEEAMVVVAYLGPNDGPGVAYLDSMKRYELEISTPSSDEVALFAGQVLYGYRGIGTVGKVVTNEYWDRAWTLPEYTSTSHRILLSGCNWMDMDDLYDALSTTLAAMRRMFQTTYGAGLHHGVLSSCTHRTWWLQSKLRLGNIRRTLGETDGGFPGSFSPWTPFALVEVLVHFRTLSATDPRDKVYAPFNLLQLPRRPEETIDVDYGLSIREVYIQAALCLLETPTWWSLSNLELCCFDGQSELPSWVPDWSAQARTHLSISPFNEVKRTDLAFGLFMHHDSVTTKYLSERDGLLLLGIKLGRVRQVWSPVDMYQTMRESCSVVLLPSKDIPYVEALFASPWEGVVRAVRSMLADVSGISDAALLYTDSRCSEGVIDDAEEWLSHNGDNDNSLLFEPAQAVDELHDDVRHEQEQQQEHFRQRPEAQSSAVVRSDEWKKNGYVLECLHGRRIALLELVGSDGLIFGLNFGLLPAEAEIDDEVWVIQGGRMFYILRQIPDAESQEHHHEDDEIDDGLSEEGAATCALAQEGSVTVREDSGIPRHVVCEDDNHQHNGESDEHPDNPQGTYSHGHAPNNVREFYNVTSNETRGKDGRYLIGEAFIHGLMTGYLMKHCSERGIILSPEEEVILY